jgi:Uma2 family endonuclease
MNLIPQPPCPSVPGEQRLLLQAVDWPTYEKFLEAVGDRRVRLTYDRGNLELRSPSPEHEVYATLLGRFVEMLTFELKLPLKACGSTTFRRQDLERGLEPDRCFYIASAARLRSRRLIDLTRDPPPDLAIEVDITSSSLNRLAIYEALRVPEVWRFDGEVLQVYRLRADGTYELGEQSLAFPFLPLAEVVPFLHQSETMDDTALAEAFLNWIRTRVVPLWKGAGDSSKP